MSNPSAPGDGNEPDPDIQESAAAADAGEQEPERRYTAPSSFDGSTQIIDAVAEPPTEIISVDDATEMMAIPTGAAPQHIPPRDGFRPPRIRRSWGWVIAVILVIAALVALAILGTVLLTRGNTTKASPEDQVRSTIEHFDTAIQTGDLAALRSITCGTTRDSYVNYDEQSWKDTYARVVAARQYPVLASIDEVVVNDDLAEANVTTFMAYAPQTRSTRSFDLQFRDEQWKICQAPA